MFAGNFAPIGWMFCNGQVLAISQCEVLFQLIGTTSGGDGQNNFALPNLQGRLPVHQGGGFTLAQSGGVETVTLTTDQIPMHSHVFQCTGSTGTQQSPVGNTPARIATGSAYLQGPPTASLAAQSIQPDGGGGQSHDNRQPYLCVSFIISLYGIFPSQS
jgi:microcystin-dependent protein